MKSQRKKTVCLNCERPLTLSDNFCPSCGQENLSTRFSLRILAYDFFNNYFSFDSRLGRSIWPFLTKPGYLTKQFNAGRRINYVHPLRLYLIISFIFFFILSLWMGTLDFQPKPSPVAANQPVLDSLRVSLNRNDEVPIPKIIEHDSVAVRDVNSFFSLMNNESLTDEQVMDSLDIETSNTVVGIRFIHQGRRILKQGADVFVPYAVKNISILMFLLLPLFAMILWLAFRRSEPYYIGHAVHALHLHSFVFILSLVALLLQFSAGLMLWGTTFIIFSVYSYLSMKHVYKQTYHRTFWKFLLVGFMYFVALSIGLVLEVAISFLLF